MQSRYYDPETGRFINADTLIVAGDYLQGTNMFTYCLNNPIMYVDPTGCAPFINKFLDWFSNSLSFLFNKGYGEVEESFAEIWMMYLIASENIEFVLYDAALDKIETTVLSSGVVKVEIYFSGKLTENGTASNYIVEMYYGNHSEWLEESIDYQNQIYFQGIIMAGFEALIGYLAPPIGMITGVIGVYLLLAPDSYQEMINEMLLYSNGTNFIAFGIYKITNDNTKHIIYDYYEGWI